MVYATTFCRYLIQRLRTRLHSFNSHIQRPSYGTLFQIDIEQVLAFKTFSELLDNMNPSNNFGAVVILEIFCVIS